MSPYILSGAHAFSPKARRANMWKDRPIIRLLILLLQPLLELAVVRLTARFCVGACCKWAATSLVEALFTQHAGTLYVLSIVLDVTLFCFCIDLILETLEKDLKVPARRWLAALYNFFLPKGKPPGSPPSPPAGEEGHAQLKAVPVKIRKKKARRGLPKDAAGGRAPAEAAPALSQAAKPRRSPRQNKSQALED